MTQVDSILTHAHIPSPHCSQRRKSHSDAVEITLKKLASFSSIRLRDVVMARNRKGHPYCDVTTIRQTRYFRSDNVRFQDGGAVDIGKLGRGDAFFRLLLLSFNVCPCTGSCCHHVHAKDYSFILVQRPVRHSGSFSVRCLSICVAYSIDYIQQC